MRPPFVTQTPHDPPINPLSPLMPKQRNWKQRALCVGRETTLPRLPPQTHLPPRPPFPCHPARLFWDASARAPPPSRILALRGFFWFLFDSGHRPHPSTPQQGRLPLATTHAHTLFHTLHVTPHHLFASARLWQAPPPPPRAGPLPSLPIVDDGSSLSSLCATCAPCFFSSRSFLPALCASALFFAIGNHPPQGGCSHQDPSSPPPICLCPRHTQLWWVPSSLGPSCTARDGLMSPSAPKTVAPTPFFALFRPFTGPSDFAPAHHTRNKGAPGWPRRAPRPRAPSFRTAPCLSPRCVYSSLRLPFLFCCGWLFFAISSPTPTRRHLCPSAFWSHLFCSTCFWPHAAVAPYFTPPTSSLCARAACSPHSPHGFFFQTVAFPQRTLFARGLLCSLFYDLLVRGMPEYFPFVLSNTLVLFFLPSCLPHLHL
jgi:hypothetical protein